MNESTLDLHYPTYQDVQLPAFHNSGRAYMALAIKLSELTNYFLTRGWWRAWSEGEYWSPEHSHTSSGIYSITSAYAGPSPDQINPLERRWPLSSNKYIEGFYSSLHVALPLYRRSRGNRPAWPAMNDPGCVCPSQLKCQGLFFNLFFNGSLIHILLWPKRIVGHIHIMHVCMYVVTIY